MSEIKFDLNALNDLELPSLEVLREAERLRALNQADAIAKRLNSIRRTLRQTADPEDAMERAYSRIDALREAIDDLAMAVHVYRL